MTDYERFGDYQPSEKSTLGTAITFLFIGLGIGSLSALLLAPRSGKQMRRMLRRKYEDTVENLSEQAEDLRDRGREWADAAREKVAPIRDRVKSFQG